MEEDDDRGRPGLTGVRVLLGRLGPAGRGRTARRRGGRRRGRVDRRGRAAGRGACVVPRRGRGALRGRVLAPGFVNLHTHVEYASYAGFGDGLGFAAWLDPHIERKRRLDPDGMRAIAELGVAGLPALGCRHARRCLVLGRRRGRGERVRHPCGGGARGLRSRRGRPRRGERARGSARQAGLGGGAAGRARGLPARALQRLARALRTASLRSARAAGRRVVTHLAESRNELDWALHGTGPMARALVPPLGEHPVDDARRARPARPRDGRRACGARRARPDRRAGGAAARRALPALERAARLRRRACCASCARPACPSASAPTARPRR